MMISLMVFRVIGSQCEVPLQVLLTLGRREAMRDGVPDVLQSLSSLPSSLSVVQFGTLPEF